MPWEKTQILLASQAASAATAPASRPPGDVIARVAASSPTPVALFGEHLQPGRGGCRLAGESGSVPTGAEIHHARKRDLRRRLGPRDSRTRLAPDVTSSRNGKLGRRCPRHRRFVAFGVVLGSGLVAWCAESAETTMQVGQEVAARRLRRRSLAARIPLVAEVLHGLADASGLAPRGVASGSIRRAQSCLPRLWPLARSSVAAGARAPSVSKAISSSKTTRLAGWLAENKAVQEDASTVCRTYR